VIFIFAWMVVVYMTSSIVALYCYTPLSNVAALAEITALQRLVT